MREVDGGLKRLNIIYGVRNATVSVVVVAEFQNADLDVSHLRCICGLIREACNSEQESRLDRLPKRHTFRLCE